MTILPVAHAALALAALTLGAWVALAIAALFDRYAIPRLEDVAPPPPDDPPLPRLSIIVTAHNEERSMERALRSLLALRYPDYEVVYVNDRSTDRTGEIAERLSDGDARLTVLHIDELPPGWFGKPHAAQRGADAATGEVLLFTDADVTFAHDAAACGVRHLVQQRLDHLTAAPRLTLTGTMLQACTIASRLLVGARQRLWKVRDPRSSAFFGVGSYTIMRADSYRAVGGHERPLLLATGQPARWPALCCLPPRLLGGRHDRLTGRLLPLVERAPLPACRPRFRLRALALHVPHHVPRCRLGWATNPAFQVAHSADSPAFQLKRPSRGRQRMRQQARVARVRGRHDLDVRPVPVPAHQVVRAHHDAGLRFGLPGLGPFDDARRQQTRRQQRPECGPDQNA